MHFFLENENVKNVKKCKIRTHQICNFIQKFIFMLKK